MYSHVDNAGFKRKNNMSLTQAVERSAGVNYSPSPEWDDILSTFRATYMPRVDSDIWSRFASCILSSNIPPPTDGGGVQNALQTQLWEQDLTPIFLKNDLRDQIEETRRLVQKAQRLVEEVECVISTKSKKKDVCVDNTVQGLAWKMICSSPSEQYVLCNLSVLMKYTVNDEKFVETIVQAFSDCILDEVKENEELLAFLVTWISANANFLSLGEHLIPCYLQDVCQKSPFYHHVLKKRTGKNIPLGAENENVVAALHRFLQQVSSYDSDHVIKRTDRAAQIVIFTEFCGGGHVSPAQALQEFLLSLGYNVHLIYAGQQSDEVCDPLLKIGAQFEDGTPMSCSEVYQKWTVQNIHHLDGWLAMNLSAFLRLTFPRKYPNNATATLINKVQEIRPHMILSSISSYNPIWPIAFRLRLPIQLFETDYSVHADLFPYWRQLSFPPEFQLLRFGVPDSDPCLLPDEVDHNSGIIDIVGYPTRSCFDPITDPKKLLEIREMWHIRQEARVLTISRGLLGSREHIVEALEDLLTGEEPLNDLWDVIVVCGTNQALVEELQEYDLTSCVGNEPRFIITGFLEAEKMAEITHISDVVDIKSGGSATNEFLVSMTQPSHRRALTTPGYSWEEDNALFLEKTGIGRWVRPELNKRTLLNELVQDQELKSVKLVNWRKKFKVLIERRIKK